MADPDSISTRISPDCPSSTQQILTAAWSHDAALVNKLCDEPGKAGLQDPVTGETPLHAAIRSCGPPSEDDTEADLKAASDAVRELLQWGAIWNDVDDHNETPGCVAWRLQRPELYELCVNAGVRAEMLFGLLEGYEKLSSGEDEDDDIEVVDIDVPNSQYLEVDGDEAPELVNAEEASANGVDDAVATDEMVEVEAAEEPKFVPPNSNAEEDVNSEAYLRSKLTYSDGKLVDDAGNGVMMAWETDIMRRSVDKLLSGKEAGKRVLNIGFGLGIIDSIIAETKPSRHHIIEAHPDVLKNLSSPDSKFGSSWEAQGLEPGAFKIFQGKWQDVCQKLLETGEVYDAIYFDTFGEDYSQLRKFFSDFVPGLLDENGVFGFFNGLGADRRICYDVYTKVVEMHLADAGLDVDWTVIDVKDLGQEGQGEWEGVKRRYWTLDKYRLPACTFLG